MKSVAILLTVPMQPFQIKTISLRQCVNCRTTWAGERDTIEPGSQINIMYVRVAYCPACRDDFVEEQAKGSYERRGKRIK